MTTLAEIREVLPNLAPWEKEMLFGELSGPVSGIVTKEGVCGGEACFIRTRIPVWVVVRALQLGSSEADVLSAYPTLTAEDLVYAYAYARVNRAEIEKAIVDNERD